MILCRYQRHHGLAPQISTHLIKAQNY
uniref:Ufm1-conjugating enzyme 1 n=1 Tax=Arundo donax TaxID=35708 RepID=A0A0A9H0Y2_ARUDO